LFRGEDEFFDAAGKQAALMLTDSELRNTVVVANSRFDGRAASFWMDSNNPLALFSPGSTISLSELPSSSSFALVLGEIELLGDFKIITSGDGFILYQITGSLNSP
jgi:hypothetical protein